MGMIRVSDNAEKIIKDFASKMGVTNTTAVDTLLAQTDVAARMDKMGKYLDKKFDDLESIIMTSAPSAPSTFRKIPRSRKVYLDWDTIRDYVFPLDTKDYDDDVYASKAVQDAWENSDCLDLGKYYISGEFVCRDDELGREQQLLNLTPKFKEYLSKYIDLDGE